MYRSITRLSHYGFAAAPPACADFRLSSARLAAWPSGLSGASLSDLLPGLLRAGQILLAERPDDAQIQQRLGVLRVRS